MSRKKDNAGPTARKKASVRRAVTTSRLSGPDQAARRGTAAIRSAEDALADPFVAEAMRRGIMRLDGDGDKIIYSLRTEQRYRWNDPEEWVRAATVAWLILDRDYPTNRIKLEGECPEVR